MNRLALQLLFYGAVLVYTTKSLVTPVDVSDKEVDQGTQSPKTETEPPLSSSSPPSGDKENSVVALDEKDNKEISNEIPGATTPPPPPSQDRPIEISTKHDLCILNYTRIRVDMPGCRPVTTRMPICQGITESYHINYVNAEDIPQSFIYKKSCVPIQYRTKPRRLHFTCKGQSRPRSHRYYFTFIQKCGVVTRESFQDSC